MTTRVAMMFAGGLALSACGLACGLSVVGEADPSGVSEPGLDAASDVRTDASIDDAAADDSSLGDGSLLVDGSLADGGLDASLDVDAGPGFCEEPGLAACYRFENAVVDESAPPVGAPTTATSINYITGLPGKGQALEFTTSSILQLPDDPSWDMTNATVEMWVYVQSRPPANSRGGLFDNQRNYAVFLQPNGVARCGTANLDSTVLPLTTWTHIACVWNATASTIIVYVNGAATAALTTSSNMPISAGDPAAIGSNIPSGEPFEGRIDSLRIFNTARTQAQILAAATN